MKNNFITKIIGATLAFAMMIGGAVGINAAKEAKEVNADTVTWVETAAASLETNDIVVIADKTSARAMSNDKEASAAPTAVAITFNNGKSEITSEVAANLKWKVAVSNGSYQFFKNDDQEKWLYCTNNNNGVRVGTNANSAFTIKSNFLFHSAQSRYVGVYNNSDWRCYTTIHANIQNTVLAFYKYTVSSDPSKTIQANSVSIYSGLTLISNAFEPNAPYNLGETLDLSASVVNYQQGDEYEDGQGDINWSSSNTNVATITSGGVVTFVGKGTSIITATAVDEGSNHAVVSASFTLDLRNAESIPGTIYQPYTVEEAIAAIDASQGVNGVYAKGIVSEIVTAYSSQYSNISFNISDDGETSSAQLQAYRCGGTEAANIAVGNLVVVTGNLIKFQNTTYEFTQGCSIVSRTIPTYTVTYDANGATSGTVPTDNTNYNRNASVTVASNTGSLAKTDYDFNGWNTKADPSENGAIHYNAGATFAITQNITLYAEWLSQEPSITAPSAFSGYTGQELDLEFTYGHIADESAISVVAADNKITVNELLVDGGEGIVAIAFNTAGNTSLSFRNNGVELATCDVTVNQSEISITGLPVAEKVLLNSTLNLGNRITINNSGIYSNSVTWSTSNSSVATVSSSGVVTGKAIGQTTITVTSNDNNEVYQSCLVRVYKGSLVNTLDLKTKTYVIADEDNVSWTCDYAVLANTTGTASTKATNYLGGDENNRTSSRMYKNNVMSITPNEGYPLSSIVFTAASDSYANALKNSNWTNATVVSSGSTVTVTPTNGASAISVVIGATVGLETVKIYIDPTTYLQTASTIKTISGVESNEGATVTNVALRFGGVIPVSTWNQINSNWAITDFGVMFARGSMLTARSLDSLEKVFKNNPADVAMVHRGSVGTPNANGDNYVFTARLNLEEADYDEVFYAVPFIVAGGEYYFLQEMHYSVRTLAEESLTSGESSLSQAALTTLKGNN